MKRLTSRQRFEKAMKRTEQYVDWNLDFVSMDSGGGYRGQLENDLFYGWQLAQRDAKRRVKP